MSEVDDKYFGLWICLLLDLSKTSDADFAEKIGTSRPTVTRWRVGEAVPHPALRPAILETLTRILSEKEPP